VKLNKKIQKSVQQIWIYILTLELKGWPKASLPKSLLIKNRQRTDYYDFTNIYHQ